MSSPKDTHISTENMDTFFVSYDDYATNSVAEQNLKPAASWWKNGARFRPADMATVLGMLVDEQLMWRVLNSGHNIIISGAAGSGKSHLLQRFISSCRGSNFSYRLTAPTGIAAFNVGGETLHGALGLGLASEDPVALYTKIVKAKYRFPKTWKFLKGTDILIIDEISMVSPEFFYKLDYLFRKARNNDSPFGGARLIMVGDFTQLGPVQIRHGTESKQDSSERFVLDTECWRNMNLARIFLNRSYRQAAGDPFLDLLNEIRRGVVSIEGKQLLESRMNLHVDAAHTDATKKTIVNNVELYIKPIDIFPYRNQVNECNKSNLTRLVTATNTESCTMYPYLKVTLREGVTRIKADDHKRATDFISTPKGKAQLAKKFPFFATTLALGAQVMMRSNKYLSDGIYNGSMGIITAIESNHIMVRFLVDGKFTSKCLEVTRSDMSHPVGKTAQVVMSQFPLTLAYAATIHKCQGLTLDSVRIDASRCFEAGQLYVALSRVRKIEDLYLIKFNMRSVLSDDRAVRFETLNEVHNKRKVVGDDNVLTKKLRI